MSAIPEGKCSVATPEGEGIVSEFEHLCERVKRNCACLHGNSQRKVSPMGVSLKGQIDEHLRKCFERRQARGKQQSSQNGTEERIAMQRILQTYQKIPRRFRGRCYLGLSELAFRLSGCGGLQCAEFACAAVCFEYDTNRSVVFEPLPLRNVPIHLTFKHFRPLRCAVCPLPFRGRLSVLNGSSVNA